LPLLLQPSVGWAFPRLLPRRTKSRSFWLKSAAAAISVRVLATTDHLPDRAVPAPATSDRAVPDLVTSGPAVRVRAAISDLAVPALAISDRAVPVSAAMSDPAVPAPVISDRAVPVSAAMSDPAVPAPAISDRAVPVSAATSDLAVPAPATLDPGVPVPAVASIVTIATATQTPARADVAAGSETQVVTGAGAASDSEKHARKFDSGPCPIGIKEAKLTPGFVPRESAFEPSALPEGASSVDCRPMARPPFRLALTG
jgi:hypothetical protein